MFKPGDLVRIKKADDVWRHLIGQIGVYVREQTDESFPNVVRPLHCAMEVRFLEDDLEYICSGEEVVRIMEEEHI